MNNPRLAFFFALFLGFILHMMLSVHFGLSSCTQMATVSLITFLRESWVGNHISQ